MRAVSLFYKVHTYFSGRTPDICLPDRNLAPLAMRSLDSIVSVAKDVGVTQA